jgi:ketosteroid isomerase-like protein
MTVMRGLCSVGLFLGLTASPAAAGLPPDLVAAVAAYDAAQVHNDVATLARLVADDFTLVNSNASVEDKRQFLADYGLPGFKIEPYVLEQRIDRAWRDGAVTGGLLHLAWTQDGRRQTRTLRIAYVWRREGGRWRATYAQVTRVTD